MNFETAGVERMRIDTTGNVLVKPTNSSNNTGLYIQNQNTGGFGSTLALGLYGYVQSAYYYPFRIEASYPAFGQTNFIVKNQPNSADIVSMSLQGNGNIGIGTTSDNGNKLNVSGSIYSSSSISSAGGMYPSGGISTDNGIVINYGYAYGLNSNNQVSSNGWYMQISTSWSNNFRFFYGGTGVGQGSARAQIDTSGNYSALSDINKKKDIALSTLGLAEVMKLKPSTFKFKDDEKQEEQIGFIAQEVKDIIPYAYYEDVQGDDKFIGLKQTAIIPVLVKAIQELKAEIETLKTNK
jgi:hypothetical protein